MSKKKYNLMNMPPKLFKYYKYDDKLNRKRLSGEVYLSSPLDFNDPCDCRVQPENNIGRLDEKEREWLNGKIRELGYDDETSKKLACSLESKDENALKTVYKKQLEKAGVLCLTSSYMDAQMWGYYADNTGICIEYDTVIFVKRLLFGVVNSMGYSLTKLLYNEKDYNLGFQERREKKATEKGVECKQPSKIVEGREIWACQNLTDSDSLSEIITNDFLRELLKDGSKKEEVLNFIRHVFVKRLVGEKICYKDKLDESKPTLFFEENNVGSKMKYFQKTNVWQHEKEFRIVVSLGGRKVIDLGKDIIKSVYFGCDVPVEKAVELACILFVNQPKCKLFQMKRLDAGGLAAHEINRSVLKNPFKTIMRQLEAKRVK